jgi:hypothetical protein
MMIIPFSSSLIDGVQHFVLAGQGEPAGLVAEPQTVGCFCDRWG